MMSGEFLWQLSVDVVQDARGLEPNLQHITQGTCVRNATWTKGYIYCTIDSSTQYSLTNEEVMERQRQRSKVDFIVCLFLFCLFYNSD